MDPGSYQIKVVARLTGLTPDVIRAWERRHGAIAPARTSTRTRLYSEQDIQRLLLLKDATTAGRSIGRIAALTNEELASLVAPVEPRRPNRQEGLSRRVIDAVERLDYLSADEALAQAAALFPAAQLIHEVVLPLLEHVGARWEDVPLGIATEHLTTGLLRTLLGSLLRTSRVDRGHRCVLLGTLPGEWHEMGLLVVALVVASQGIPVCYLGPNLPAAELSGAARKIGAYALAISLVMPPDEMQLEALESLAQDLPSETRLWLGGQGALEVPKGLLPGTSRVFAGLADLEGRLTRAVRS